MKKVLQIVLGIAVVVLVWVLYNQLMTPIRFQKDMAVREAAVINRIKDIRTAEQAFKAVNQRYTGSFDTLINFVLRDSMTFERTIGSKDDSVAVAQGLVRTEQFRIPVIDTIFGRHITVDEVQKLRYVPYTDNQKEYALQAGMFMTESGVVVPVFEARAHYSWFLEGLDKQEVINLIDERENTLMRYPGIKVGALNAATNDAGNWE